MKKQPFTIIAIADDRIVIRHVLVDEDGNEWGQAEALAEGVANDINAELCWHAREGHITPEIEIVAKESSA